MNLSNEELGEYLKDLRIKAHLSTRQVYELSGVSNGYLSLVENGKRRASAIVLKKLAQFYNVDYMELYEKAGYVDLIDSVDTELLEKIGALPLPSTDIVSVPIIGLVKAGYDYLAQENHIGTITIEKSIVGDGDKYFALEVKGDSMAPDFKQGDIVIVRQQNDCENNDIAIVIVNGDEGTIKKIRKSESGIILQPLNPNYEPIVYTNQEIKSLPVTIVGVVKQLKRNL